MFKNNSFYKIKCKPLSGLCLGWTVTCKPDTSTKMESLNRVAQGIDTAISDTKPSTNSTGRFFSSPRSLSAFKIVNKYKKK